MTLDLGADGVCLAGAELNFLA